MRNGLSTLALLGGICILATGCGGGGGSSSLVPVSTDPLQGSLSGTYSESGVGTGTFTGNLSQSTGDGVVTDDATKTAHNVSLASAGWSAGRVAAFNVRPWADAVYAVGTMTRQANGHFTGSLTRYDASNNPVSPPAVLDVVVK